MVAHSWLSRSRDCVSRLDARLARKSQPAAASTSVKMIVYAAVRRNRSERVIFFRAGALRGTLYLTAGGLDSGTVRWFIGRFDHVADAAHGLNQLRRVFVVDLAAQM